MAIGRTERCWTALLAWGRTATAQVGHALVVALLALTAVTAATVDFMPSAHAQGWFGLRPPGEIPQRGQRPAQRQNSYQFPFWGRPAYNPRQSYQWPSYRPTHRQFETDDPRAIPEPRRRAPRAVSEGGNRAPPHRKPEVEPAKTAVVLGDSMADWLAYGLEEASSESNELGVTRKHKTGSSLIRNDQRDFDWVQGARDALASEKADLVVMMIGLADRHAIRELPKQRNTQQKPASDPNQPNVTMSEEERKAASVLHEFRSDKWVELYGKRIDEVIAVLKAKRVPVLWVGLPPIRGARSRADLSFLNEIYKERAARAGIIYVDVWEGFVDESGDFSNYGPDVLGQVRRLRSGDGVHFTRAGARKLAHFVDREIKRLLSRDTPIALPIPDEPPPVQIPMTPSGPAGRPLAGPVVALTGGAAPAAETLAGARPQDAQGADPLAARVLVKGEAPDPQAGRADNFVWPRPNVTAANDVAEPPAEPVTTAVRPPARPAARTVTRPGQPGPATQSASRPQRPVQ